MNEATRQSGCLRVGMTLVEMVTSMSILCVLVVAMGSAILISTRALEVSAAAETDDAEKVRLRLIADLQTALSFSEQTATAATFTVPDRDSDGQPETLRYAWSGTLGDPLTYSYNDGNAITLAADVQQFNLTYLLRTMQGMGGVTPEPNENLEEQESEEVLLIFHDGASNAQIKFTILSSKVRTGQYFKPELPTNAVSWKITRVDVRLLWRKADSFRVQIRPSDADLKPTQTVLEQAIVSSDSLQWGYFSWIENNFATLGNLAPESGYCVVVQAVGGLGLTQYEKGGNPMTPNTHWMTSSNSGTSWTTPENTKDMRFYVYGTYTTLGEPEWP